MAKNRVNVRLFSAGPRAVVPNAGDSSTMSACINRIAADTSCRLFAAASACASSNIRSLSTLYSLVALLPSN
jgi:hypothetical protein